MTMNLLLLMATSKTSTLPPIEENQDPKYKHSNTNKVFYFHNFAGQVFPRARLRAVAAECPWNSEQTTQALAKLGIARSFIVRF